MKIYLIAALLLVFSNSAFAQGGRYTPFPPDFEKLSAAEKEKVGKSVDENTDQYLHSPEYGQTLSKFVHDQNPKGINECTKLKMSATGNKIHITEPLLWRSADDRHPLVGKWEQTASFEGCGHVYAFTISATANKAEAPELALKN